MRADRTVATTRRHFAWLLWLAMLVPLAQAVGHWHAASHAASAVTDGEFDSDDGKVLQSSHCAICLSIAAAGDGAMPPTVLAPSLLEARHAKPAQSYPVALVAASWLGYRSRAPPFVIL